MADGNRLITEVKALEAASLVPDSSGLNFNELSYNALTSDDGIFANNAFILPAGAQADVLVPLSTTKASDFVSWGAVTLLGRSALKTHYQGLFIMNLQGFYDDLGGDSDAVKQAKLHGIIPKITGLLGSTPPGPLTLSETHDSTGARVGLNFSYYGLVLAHGIEITGDAAPGGMPAGWDIKFDKADASIGATQWNIVVTMQRALTDDGTNLPSS